MDATYNVLRSKSTITQIGLSLFGHCCGELLAWHARERTRVNLSSMGDRELQDIGIGRGEIDYVALNPSTDPRSAVHSGQ